MKFSDVSIGALFILGGEVFIKISSKAAQGMHTRRTIKPAADLEVTA